jgi:hypothetical protein
MCRGSLAGKQHLRDSLFVWTVEAKLDTDAQATTGSPGADVAHGAAEPHHDRGSSDALDLDDEALAFLDAHASEQDDPSASA